MKVAEHATDSRKVRQGRPCHAGNRRSAGQSQPHGRTLGEGREPRAPKPFALGAPAPEPRPGPEATAELRRSAPEAPPRAPCLARAGDAARRPPRRSVAGLLLYQVVIPRGVGFGSRTVTVAVIIILMFILVTIVVIITISHCGLPSLVPGSDLYTWVLENRVLGACFVQ